MDKLQVKFNEVSAHCADLNSQLNAKLLDDTATPEDVKKIKDELNAAKVRRDELNEQIKAIKPLNQPTMAIRRALTLPRRRMTSLISRKLSTITCTHVAKWLTMRPSR